MSIGSSVKLAFVVSVCTLMSCTAPKDKGTAADSFTRDVEKLTDLDLARAKADVGGLFGPFCAKLQLERSQFLWVYNSPVGHSIYYYRFSNGRSLHVQIEDATERIEKAFFAEKNEEPVRMKREDG